MAWPHAEKYEAELRFRVPRILYDRFALLCALRGERRREWLTRKFIEAVEEELLQFPVHVVWLRPGARIFSLEGSAYVPLARAAGGERAWPIEVVVLPKTVVDTQQGWRCDVTSDRGGFEGRSVYVPLDDVLGVEPKPTPPTPPAP